MDIAASNREAGRVHVSGGGILSKWGSASRIFWNSVYNRMVATRGVDDQSPILFTLKRRWHIPWKFRWLSSNWFYASHAITESGRFLGSASCYRSSVVVTGPVQWVHGHPYECDVVNGKQNENAYRMRAFFMRKKCVCKEQGPMMVFSAKEMKEATHPYIPPPLNWKNDSTRPSDGLFWIQWRVCYKEAHNTESIRQFGAIECESSCVNTKVFMNTSHALRVIGCCNPEFKHFSSSH